MNKIERLMGVAAMATPGPWHHTDHRNVGLMGYVWIPIPEIPGGEHNVAAVHLDVDRAFIAAADPSTIIAWAKALLLTDEALHDQGDCICVGGLEPTCPHLARLTKARDAIAKIKEGA